MIGRLQVRAAPAARVPHGKYLNVTAVHAVVEEVVYPSQMQTPHPLSANIPHRCADPRLNAQEGKSLREFLVKGFRRKRTILIPPEGGRSICACARFVTRTFTAHLATTTRELREHFLR